MIIFITPHILDTPTELLRMTNSQRELAESQTTDDGRRDILEVQENLVYPRYADPIVPMDLEQVPLLEFVPSPDVMEAEPEDTSPDTVTEEAAAGGQ